jgi:hypothetical protein
MSPDGEKLLVLTPSNTADGMLRAVLNWRIEQPAAAAR